MRERREGFPALPRLLLAIVCALCLALPAAGQTVTDGDGLKLHGVTYRLWGVDVPERRQTCPDGRPAGTLAAMALRDLIAHKQVVCTIVSRHLDRKVARCMAGGVDHGGEMVGRGYAWATSRHSLQYLDA